MKNENENEVKTFEWRRFLPTDLSTHPPYLIHLTFPILLFYAILLEIVTSSWFVLYVAYRFVNENEYEVDSVRVSTATATETLRGVYVRTCM